MVTTMGEEGLGEERSLLVLILDITPSAWGERAMLSDSINPKRLAAGKPSVGPAKLVDDLLGSVVTFLSAHVALNRDNGVIVIGVAGPSHVGVLYPRKTDFGSLLQYSASHSGGNKVDLHALQQGLKLGVAELVGRCYGQNNSGGPASIASAMSLALCLFNRFIVASGNAATGISALANSKASNNRIGGDEGILSLLNGKNKKEKTNHKKFFSSRMLVIQASEDKIQDYNAIMNCVFAANRANVIIDGCFVAKSSNDTSPFLEQACDRTGGIFIKPTGRSQVGGALTQVLMTVFLPPNLLRDKLNLPVIDKVDFRARCFETGESVDIAYVCNQCLSIFKHAPKDKCHTCLAKVMTGASSSDIATDLPPLDEPNHNNKRQKID